MNIQELKQELESLNDESRLQFMMEGKRVMNRFDHNEKKIETTTIEDKASFILYSLIGALIVYKAQGKEKGKEGKEVISKYFSIVEKNSPEDVRANISSEIMKAEAVIQSFLFSTENISMAELLSSLAPIVFVKLSLTDIDIDKKSFHSLSKNKEAIFNLAVLYIRSLFKAVLTLDGIDPIDIKIDANNIESGIIRYQNNIIIPTGMNAFTMKAMRLVLLNKLDELGRDFSLESISMISCLYLTKQVLVALPLR